MHVVDVQHADLARLHPRDAFFNQFPMEKRCTACRSTISLDSPQDVSLSVTVVDIERLYWRCPLCGSKNDLGRSDEDMRGYRATFPYRYILQQHGIAIAFWLCIVMLPIILVTVAAL